MRQFRRKYVCVCSYKKNQIFIQKNGMHAQNLLQIFYALITREEKQTKSSLSRLILVSFFVLLGVRFTNGETWVRSHFLKDFLAFFFTSVCVCVVVVFSKQKFLGFFIHFAWSKICILLSHRERVFVILGRGVKSCHILHSFSKKNTRLVCLVVCGLVSLESVCWFCLSLIVVSLLFWRKPNFTPKARTSRRKS